MDFQKKYDELDNIVITLDELINETTDEYFIDMLNELKFEAQNQLEEVEAEISNEEEKELFRQNREFEESRL